MKNFPNALLLICIFLAPCLAILTTIFSHRKIHTKTRKERRKGLLILLGIFIFVQRMLVIAGFLIPDNTADRVQFLKETFLNRGYIGLMTVFVFFFLYGYFRKDKSIRDFTNK